MLPGTQSLTSALRCGTAVEIFARRRLQNTLRLHHDVHVVQYRVTFGKCIEVIGVLARPAIALADQMKLGRDLRAERKGQQAYIQDRGNARFRQQSALHDWATQPSRRVRNLLKHNRPPVPLAPAELTACVSVPRVSRDSRGAAAELPRPSASIPTHPLPNGRPASQSVSTLKQYRGGKKMKKRAARFLVGERPRVQSAQVGRVQAQRWGWWEPAKEAADSPLSGGVLVSVGAHRPSAGRCPPPPGSPAHSNEQLRPAAPHAATRVSEKNR